MRVGPDKIWEDHSIKLLGVSIDNKLKFDEHVLNIIKKANSKLSTLSRLTKFMTLQKKRTLYKAFVESQFKYCSLSWMFHGRKTNCKINRLQERALIFLALRNYYLRMALLLFMSKTFRIWL